MVKTTLGKTDRLLDDQGKTNMIQHAHIQHRLNLAGLRSEHVTPETVDTLKGLKGAYLLLIRLDEPHPLRINRLGSHTLVAGTYLYAGSAYGPGGLAARLSRHFRRDKKAHWHIDHMTREASQLTALAIAGGRECALVEHLLQNGDAEVAVDGFGSSDCARCRSHLLHARPKTAGKA